MIHHTFLIKYAEIALKGKNRHLFEEALVQQIKYAVKKLDREYAVRRAQGRIYVDIEDDVSYDDDEVIDALGHVFGIVGICPIISLEDDDFEGICRAAVEHMGAEYPDREGLTFKVNARRARKDYFKDSMEINADVGEAILDAYPELRVDVHHPDINLYIEIRETISIYSKVIPGPGGMPVGTSGKGMLLHGDLRIRRFVQGMFRLAGVYMQKRESQAKTQNAGRKLSRKKRRFFVGSVN